MVEGNSVTRWVGQLANGDEQAAAQLWERFFTRLTAIARQRLQGRSLAMADDEDIALSAFNSFCVGLQQGRFTELNGRDSLWRLLSVITARKVADQFAFDGRSKRDSGRVVSLSSDDDVVLGIVSREPTPELAAEFSEQLTRLLDALSVDDLRQVALLKLEGYSHPEIAQRLNRSLTTIERKLRTIRSIWSQGR